MTAAGHTVAMATDVAFLFDVDNTLLHNDAVTTDLRAYLVEHFGQASADRYWEEFEALRGELGYADYLGALQRFRAHHPNECRLLATSLWFVDYPFAERLYDGALDVLAHVAVAGPTVIVSDGDVVFQPRKIQRAGLWDAVDGRVFIYVHKEEELDDVARRQPADHYVMVDDKLRILTAMKQQWGERLTTVFVRQGHYATPDVVTQYPPADVTVERIGDLLDVSVDYLLQPRARPA